MSKSYFKQVQQPKIEESYDYAEQVRRQIERCLEASAIQDSSLRDETFKACVLALENLVPFEDRDAEFDKEIADCTTQEEEWQYRNFAGKLIGNPENPVNGSPWLEEVPVTNWNQYFRVLFNKFVALKVTVRRGTSSG